MKFLADMGISLVTTAWLNEQGHDSKHLSEEQLHRLSDPAIFSKAEKENRTVLTTDLDFGEIAVMSRSAKSGLFLSDALYSCGQAEVLDAILKLHREGKTFVIVTHNSEIAKKGEKVFRIKYGSLSGEN